MKSPLFILFSLFSVMLSAQELDYQISPSGVNTKFAEFGITYFKDGTVLFASSKKNEEDKAFRKNRRRTNKQLFLELYLGRLNENGDITELELFSDEANNRYFEADITFSPDYNTVYFTWNNFFNTRTRQDSAKWKTLHLVKANLKESRIISQLEPLPFNSSDYSIRNPALSPDGSVLFFASDMEGGYGGYDIYRVFINNDGYSKPENLGPGVNSSNDEVFPFNDRSGDLYFSSNGHGSSGGLDVFKSILTAGGYSMALPLPAPVNSTADDFAFVLNSSEDAGFITSNRKDGMGDVDLYRFTVSERPQTCTNTFNGTLLDEAGGFALVNAQVLIYKNEELIEEKHLHGGNTFAIELECESNYTFEIKKNFYDSVVLDLSTDTMPGTLLEQEIKMRRARCLRAIVVNITGSGALVPLTDVELTLRQGDRVVETLTGSGSIQFQSSLSCDRQYRITALKDGYRPFNRSLNISSSDPELIELDVRMIPEIEIITRRGERMISTNRINFELNEFEITDSGADELDKLITYLKKYPAIRIEVRNHTDSRAPDDYNMTLSENRALAISNYLVAGGIGPDRVRGKGLGETRLLNKCANGVDCTQAEHEVNRRTEFVILED